MTLCHSFYHLQFLTFIHTIQSYALSFFIICRGPSSFIFIVSPLSKRSLHGVPSRELNSVLRLLPPPALQQADALPTELRRTLLSYAAPLTELRRIRMIRYLNQANCTVLYEYHSRLQRFSGPKPVVLVIPIQGEYGRKLYTLLWTGLDLQPAPCQYAIINNNTIFAARRMHQ